MNDAVEKSIRKHKAYIEHVETLKPLCDERGLRHLKDAQTCFRIVLKRLHEVLEGKPDVKRDIPYFSELGVSHVRWASSHVISNAE